MKVVATCAAAMVLAGGLTAGVTTMTASASESAVPADDEYGRHEGMRCRTKNKIIKVGHGSDRIRMKCTMGNWRGKRVLVWKFAGMA